MPAGQFIMGAGAPIISRHFHAKILTARARKTHPFLRPVSRMHQAQARIYA